MCGRYSLFSDPQVLGDHFNLTPPSEFIPRYNIAPGQIAPVVRLGANGPQFAMMYWGLIPHWAKDNKKFAYSTINARAETVAEKPVFRTPFRRTRCLVPSTGFYEWADEGEKTKQPYLIQHKSHVLMAFAGLWDHWTDGKEQIDSYSIIVTNANQTVSQVHDRMPVILKPEDYISWLDSDTDTKSLMQLLAPSDDEDIVMTPVSRHVNNPLNEDPACIKAIRT